MHIRLHDRFDRSRFTVIDVAALLVFAAVWAYYIITVRYGFCTPDESFFWNVAQRLTNGDRLIVDEWCPGQFFGIFMYLPYRLFLAVRGSTTGIILFSRYLFLAFNAAFYWILYAFLRKYRWPALLASLLFSLYVPMDLFSCSYYALVVRLLMIVCLLLFSEKKTPLSLLLAGVLLSCAVLSQPGIAFLYVGFTVLVWIRFFRQKKGKRFLDDFAFCLETRAWKYITISVAVCAAAFLGWLFVRGGSSTVFHSIPYIFTDPEYDFSSGGNARGFFVQKLLAAVQVYGLWCMIPTLLIVGLSIAYACGLFREKRETVRRVLFGLACAVWILSCVLSFRLSRDRTPDSFFTMYPVPMFWFGFVCYLLGSKKNKRFLYFWGFSLCVSLCVDFFSDVVLSIGAPISYIADLLFFRDLVRELFPEPLFLLSATERRKRKAMRIYTSANQKRDKKEKTRNDLLLLWCTRAVCICFAAWIGFICMFENTAFPEHLILRKPLFSLPYTCTDGPWRSLRVSKFIGDNYKQRLADMDAILEKKPKNLYVCGLTPDLYLYTDLPYAAYSPWALHEAPYLNRQILYWNLHPDRLPSCIYVPFYDAADTFIETKNQPVEEAALAWICESLDPLCDYTPEQGQGGYILYVSQWHLPEG